MISLLQRWLVYQLVLLQLIAPLVHAHSVRVESAGFHIPGLEFVSAPDQGAKLATITASKDDGTIISVSSGLQRKDFSNFSVNLYLLTGAHSLQNTLYTQWKTFNFTEGSNLQLNVHFHSAIPRAPPVFIF